RLSISAIILTYNEEKNIEQCLRSIYDWVDEIFIVDSFSTDKTLEIARKYTDKIYQHKWENYAKQYIWALENLPIRNEWVLRLDADERWTEDGLKELSRIIFIDSYDGINVRIKIFFMGKWMRFGGTYPNYFLRIFRKSKSKVENRWMDEHIIVNGNVYNSSIDVLEQNYDRMENISLWVNKHNNYATREAIDYLILKYNIGKIDTVGNLTGHKTERKRWLKENFYYKLPLFIRAFLYYFYRYFFKLGFLDGTEGFIWHFLQGLWYRFLVDVKIYQIEKKAKSENKDIKTVISELYGYNL
ncbi:MAG: glycosyltransferase family 2 protein, partial [Deltaproteobacteria bacterium]|nr:glycosyltransferase family 2 protein [Deltaproteobacteria bacterium]